MTVRRRVPTGKKQAKKEETQWILWMFWQY